MPYHVATGMANRLALHRSDQPDGATPCSALVHRASRALPHDPIPNADTAICKRERSVGKSGISSGSLERGLDAHIGTRTKSPTIANARKRKRDQNQQQHTTILRHLHHSGSHQRTGPTRPNVQLKNQRAARTAHGNIKAPDGPVRLCNQQTKASPASLVRTSFNTLRLKQLFHAHTHLVTYVKTCVKEKTMGNDTKRQTYEWRRGQRGPRILASRRVRQHSLTMSRLRI